MTFDRYLKGMNLLSGQEDTPKAKPTKEKALQTAFEILQLDKQKKGGETND